MYHFVMSCFIWFHKLWYHHLSWRLISQALDGAVTYLSPFPPISEKSGGKRMYSVEQLAMVPVTVNFSVVIIPPRSKNNPYEEGILGSCSFYKQRLWYPETEKFCYTNCSRSHEQDILCESRKNGAPYSYDCFSVARSCPALCNPVDCSTPGFPVLHSLPKFAHTHVCWVNDAIQPSHPLLPPRVEQYTNLWRDKEALLRFISWEVTEHRFDCLLPCLYTQPRCLLAVKICGLFLISFFCPRSHF